VSYRPGNTVCVVAPTCFSITLPEGSLNAPWEWECDAKTCRELPYIINWMNNWCICWFSWMYQVTLFSLYAFKIILYAQNLGGFMFGKSLLLLLHILFFQPMPRSYRTISHSAVTCCNRFLSLPDHGYRMSLLTGVAWIHLKEYAGGLPYFPVDNAHLMYNAHPVFSVLTNFLIDTAHLKIMELYDWLWRGPYLGILHPWVQENVPPSFVRIHLCKPKKRRKLTKDKTL
jgi:hypothetical protein